MRNLQSLGHLVSEQASLCDFSYPTFTTANSDLLTWVHVVHPGEEEALRRSSQTLWIGIRILSFQKILQLWHWEPTLTHGHQGPGHPPHLEHRLYFTLFYRHIELLWWTCCFFSSRWQHNQTNITFVFTWFWKKRGTHLSVEKRFAAKCQFPEWNSPKNWNKCSLDTFSVQQNTSFQYVVSLFIWTLLLSLFIGHI